MQLNIPEEIENPTTDLLDFTRYTKPDFIPNWHHRLLADELMLILNDELEEDGLLISMPPSHSKSEMAVRRMVAFYLGLNPKAKILIGTYDKKLSLRMSRDIQKIIMSAEYQELFPTTISKTKKAPEEWETAQGGYVLAVSVGSGVTGAHFDLIIGDDLFQGWRAAQSAAIRNKTINWYDADFSNRETIGSKTVKRIIMGTRWHDLDVQGILIEREKKNPDAEKFKKVYLPGEFTEENLHLRHPRDTRKLGEPLFPAHKDEKALKKEKAKGLAKYKALYLCLPFKATGEKLNPDWFKKVRLSEVPSKVRVKRYHHLPELSSMNTMDISYCTCKTAKDSRGNVYVLDCKRHEVGYGDYLKKVNQISDIERGIFVGFKKSTKKKDLFTRIKKNRPRGRKFKEIEFSTPLSIAQMAENGKIHLVEGDWNADLLEEIQMYSDTGQDEKEASVHALAGAVNMYRLKRGA